MTDIPSPCMRICYRDSNDICFGCRRNSEEIGNWSKYSNEEKLEVIENTHKRLNVSGETPPGNFLR
ncbi:MAG: DUF1289 domain-containing protein [Lentimicrobiaceae bacterium]|nr:DUF1289 domain-containing protein [Lentimicrobiaceae bacterium]MDG1901349.1 DUF1289 domain-containing protein [Bacteroidales bacterium]MDG2081184.1 DUF1289 domain-containing protein [Bacteroidales bacterium]